MVGNGYVQMEWAVFTGNLNDLLRHCLPPNYVFKKKGEVKVEEDDNKETLE